MSEISGSSVGQEESKILDSINDHLDDRRVKRISGEVGKLLKNKVILDRHRESIEDGLSELSDNGLSSIIWLINRLEDEIDVMSKIVNQLSNTNKESQEQPTDGKKFDSDKPRHTLIDPHFEQCLIDILEYGAKKYGVDNWQGLDNFEDRYINAIYRHLSEIRKGNLEDSESGLPHLGHIAASVMFLYWFNHVKTADDNKN